MTERALIHRELVRQTALLFFVFALLFALLGAGVYSMVSSNIYRNADENLQAIGMESDYITLDAAGSGSAIVDDVVVEEPDGAAPSDATAIDDLSLTLQQSIVDADPQFITLIRNEQGDLLETVGLYASYPSFLRHIPFDKNDLERVYQIAAGGHEYRGITYAASDEGETTYLQTLVNVDSEIAILDGFTRTLIVYLAAAVVVAAGASYLLSRRTLKPIVANMRAQTEFVQNASHELRTPLTSILAFARILRGVDSLDAKTRSAVEEIEANATLLLNMVNNILTISKAEAHKNELVVEPVDFVDLLGFIRKSLEPVAKNKGIALTAKTDADVPVSMADWEKLRRIVENLVDNAIKYTHVGGRVDVRATFDGACIVVSVADDGMGIDEADQEGIFERYRQAGQSPNRRYRGTGLGLAVVKELAELHGGSVSVASARKLGNTFTVRIPYVAVDTEEYDEEDPADR